MEGENIKIEKGAERGAEQVTERAPEKPVQSQMMEEAQTLPVIDETTAAAAVPQDEELVIIKSILSENLVDMYYQMPPDKRQRFRRKGEEAALKIRKILKQTKVTVHDIVNILINWLKLLPGVSRYFLEQEAKIKTDKILKMKKDGQILE
jgi:hypothetical protein